MPKKKSSWLKKIASWVQGSLQKFAEEGFSDAPTTRKKKKSSLKLTIRKKPSSKKPAKKSQAKKRVVKKATVKKTKTPVKLKPIKAAPKPKTVAIKSVPTKSKLKPAPAPIVKAKPLPGVLVGEIAYYFAKANACAFKVMNVELKEGATILIQGPETKLKMKIKSIQINRIPVPSGKPGEDIGIGVTKPVAAGDKVYLV